MAEYIEREAAIAWFMPYVHAGESIEADVVISDLKGMKAADVEPVQEWISVKDRLPPYNHDVLVYRPNMAMKILVDNYAGYYGEDDDEWHEGWEKYGKDIHGKSIITHWAHLPMPPKGE